MVIPILGKPYRVECVPNEHLAGNMGSATRGRQFIAISSELALEQQEDTLLHEVIHIISDELALGFTEETVQRLAVGLHSAGYRLEATK